MLITNGGKQAVYQAFATLLDPGDEVLLPAPYWTTYPEAITLAGGVPVVVTTGPDADYLRHGRAARGRPHAAHEGAAVVLAVEPDRLGRAPGSSTEAVGRWAVEHGVWVITDEIYEHLVYDGAEAVSMPVAVPELADTCVVLNGVAKTYAMTGWRVGWMGGPRRRRQGGDEPAEPPQLERLQRRPAAALEAVSGPLDAVAEMRAAFDRRRRTIVELLSAIPGVQCPTPRGAFYAYPAVQELIGTELRGARIDDTVGLAAAILEHAEVAVVPGEAFGTPGFLRLSYALADDDLRTGVERMGALLAEAK